MLWSKWCLLVISYDRFLQVLGWYCRYCWCCLFAFFHFIIKPIIRPLILSSQFILWLVISHKNVLPFRIFGSMSEVFLRKFLRNNIYFISKKCAVPKNSEASMKTIHTEIVFNWPNQHVRRSKHPHKHLKWRPFQQLSTAFSH